MKIKNINQIAFSCVVWFLFLCSNNCCRAADTVSAKFFPLVVGNSYTYRNTQMFGPETRSRSSITKDTVINNKKYFYCKGFPGLSYGSVWVRYDSSRSNLLIYTGGASCSNYSGEVIMDSLAMSVNNSINCTYGSINLRRCTGTGSQVLFGQTRNSKSFLHDGIIYSNVTYVEGIGIAGYCSGEPPPCEGFTTLIGCVLNGVVYGDTLLTGVQQTNTSVPDKFYLAQNYPNPFNPETIISFSISTNSFTSLKIYNILGKEVETLVSKELFIGNYDFKWNASAFPSGVYYCKLTAGEFSDTKRMVLTK